MSQHPVSDREFELQHSYYVEEVVESFNRRLGTILTFMQFLLGSSVVAEIGSAYVTGLAIAVIAALQATYKFGERAEHGRHQKLAYAKLIDRFRSGDTENLYDDVTEARKSDSPASSSFQLIAQQCAYIKVAEDDKIKLTLFHKALALFVGATQVFSY